MGQNDIFDTTKIVGRVWTRTKQLINLRLTCDEILNMTTESRGNYREKIPVCIPPQIIIKAWRIPESNRSPNNFIKEDYHMLFRSFYLQNI